MEFLKIECRIMEIQKLFGEDYLEAYYQGISSYLTRNRNCHLGSLLMSERSVFYIQILYRLLLFRRDHELEPLNEDIYSAVKKAQESVNDDDYLPDQFNYDIKQLMDWQILICRIEKERLRGYRDSRRNKFRYKLTGEALAFLIWLEERLHDDLEETVVDTRNLLVDVHGCLKETLRSLNRFTFSHSNEEQAREILYRIFRLNDLTMQINISLGEFNARLHGFLVRNYKIDDAKRILHELETYIDTYMKKLHQLRSELIPDLQKLSGEKNVIKLERCLLIMEEEKKKMSHLIRSGRNRLAPARVPKRLLSFYRSDGTLDRLCQRINASAMMVWGKLRAHLRELERRNFRLESLRQRIEEISMLPKDGIPHKFFYKLLATVQMVSDPQYWDEIEKANPPQPRRESDRRAVQLPTYLRDKIRGDGPVQSLEQARLEHLKQWIIRKLITDNQLVRVSEGTFDHLDDFGRIIELAKGGLLDNGRKLNSIGYSLAANGQIKFVEIESCKLHFNDMIIRKENDG